MHIAEPVCFFGEPFVSFNGVIQHHAGLSIQTLQPLPSVWTVGFTHPTSAFTLAHILGSLIGQA